MLPRVGGGHTCSLPWVALTKAVVLVSPGVLSEEGLLVYLHVLQTFLSQLPASPAGASSQDSTSDSEDESEEADKPASPVSPHQALRCTGSLSGSLTPGPFLTPTTLRGFLCVCEGVTWRYVAWSWLSQVICVLIIVHEAFPAVRLLSPR